MVIKKKENKKSAQDEMEGVTEFEPEPFQLIEEEKYNTKFPAIVIPGEVEDDIDNDYDIKDEVSDEED